VPKVDGLSISEGDIILRSFVFIPACDRQTDAQTGRQTCCKIRTKTFGIIILMGKRVDGGINSKSATSSYDLAL